MDLKVLFNAVVRRHSMQVRSSKKKKPDVKLAQFASTLGHAALCSVYHTDGNHWCAISGSGALLDHGWTAPRGAVNGFAFLTRQLSSLNCKCYVICDNFLFKERLAVPKYCSAPKSQYGLQLLIQLFFKKFLFRWDRPPGGTDGCI